MEVEEDEDEPEEKTKCQVCIEGCKHVTAFILSHVGLLSLVVGYCVIGAFTFEALEARNEIQEKRKMTGVRLNVSHYLWNMTQATNLIHPERWAANTTKVLQEFERDLINAIKKDGWDGNENEEQLNWTFTGSLFYSIIT
ncbi:Uncoordinated protein 58 [Folsomia candida]|uniref:Uncoordinated protein 58 n=1 Tax=Folsomia candida TaxID=158441 RepID=A0A226EY26_FOLCA|nr:Uncoordinated protein 58 [Folsomia candida]